MKQDIPWQLLEKYFAQKTNQSEQLVVDNWLKNADENEIIFEQLQLYFSETGTLPIDYTPNIEMARQNVMPKTAKRITLWSVAWKVAAVVVITLCSWLVIQNNIVEKVPIYASIKTSDTTQSSILLADGSKVWLNRNSNLKYPKSFGDTREVYLEGEAFFEIAHDAKHPFIVHSGKTQTRVLGTKFNVRSYAAEKHISVVLTEGKVAFQNSENRQIILQPGQIADYDKTTDKIEKFEIKNPNYASWKTHEFTFNAQTLETVIQSLSQVYRFRYQFKSNQSRKLTATFKQQTIAQILETIAIAADVKIEIQNKVYIIQ